MTELTIQTTNHNLDRILTATKEINSLLLRTGYRAKSASIIPTDNNIVMVMLSCTAVKQEHLSEVIAGINGICHCVVLNVYTNDKCVFFKEEE
jgi:hypothetical protein